MLKLLVVGGFEEDAKNSADVAEFAKAIGAEIVRQGHVLLSGCRTHLDGLVAEAANEILVGEAQDPKMRLISYVLEKADPVHNFGKVRQSRLVDWELGSPGLMTPEPIDLADVVILIGGYEGTHRAANWSRIAGKPLLPITRFGGAARQIYYAELDRFSRTYAPKIEKTDYENLSDVTSSCRELAETVLSLAERVKVSNDVFVVMSFADDPDLEDAYETFKVVCKSEKYECSRVDDESIVPRILPEILNRLNRCAFAIVDLSDEKVNVYYELGYGDALGKPLVVTAKEGTQLPFDAKDIPVIFWKNQKSLRDQLTKKIKAIAATQGR